MKSAPGKTTLLYHLTALALPSSVYGGKASSVVWLDTDGRFSALRLSHALASTLTKHNSNISPQDKDGQISSALAHLHLIKSTSSTSLLTALKHLPAYLLSPTNPSRRRSVGLVILDSATAFQHQDRLEAELARLSNPSLKSNSQPTRNAELIRELRTLQERFNCTILLTTTTIPSAPHSKNMKSAVPDGIAGESSGISPWTAFATLTLHLHRLPVAQFAPGMSLDECLRDRDKRQETVSKARVKVGPDLEGAESEIWRMGVRKRVMAVEGRGSFIMGLAEKGFEFAVG